MKVIIQRVLSASVTVDNQVVASIGRGILAFAAVAPDDTPKEVEYIANRLLKLKLWDSEDGSRWKLSVVDMDYEILLVSQFTLLATIKKGNKPDFHGACPPALAKDIYTSLLQKARELYAKEKGLTQKDGNMKVQDGVFGAMMQVGLVNDGPVTFEVSTSPKNDSQGTTDSPLELPSSNGRVHKVQGKLKKGEIRQVNEDEVGANGK